jgi:hypothetical protein
MLQDDHNEDDDASGGGGSGGGAKGKRLLLDGGGSAASSSSSRSSMGAVPVPGRGVDCGRRYRQTVVLSSALQPGLLGLLARHCDSHAGKVGRCCGAMQNRSDNKIKVVYLGVKRSWERSVVGVILYL